MEALRILAMTMILTGHFFFHGLKTTVKSTDFHFAVEPLFVCGVDLFFLISGWFGIRFSVRSMVRFIMVVLCFIGVNMLALTFAGIDLSAGCIADTLFFPVSRSRYWFIMVYMALMIMAPLLNAGLKAMGNRQMNAFVILFSLFNMYSCSIGDNYVSGNGYTIAQAIWLYCVAFCLRRNKTRFDRIGRKWYMFGFLFFSLCSSVALCLSKDWEWMDYNSPLVVLASVSLFLYFTQLNFKNSFVNTLAPAAFGCYLLQDGMFGHTFLYLWMERTYLDIIHSHGQWIAVMSVFFYFYSLLVAFWTLSFLLTPPANALGSRVGTVVERLNRRMQSKFGLR